MQAGLNTHGLNIDMESLDTLVNALNELDGVTQVLRSQRPDMADEQLHVQAAYSPTDGNIYSYTLLQGSYMEWDADVIPFGDWTAAIPRQEILDTLFRQWKGRMTMAKQINVRIDPDVKAQAERVCADIGLTLSAAINIYLRKIAAEKRIPFDLSSKSD